MKTLTHTPVDGVYAPVGDYVHALEVREPGRLLFVAGTMGLDPSGVPGATLGEQLELLWSNIRGILASAEMTVDNVVRVTSYLRDVAYVAENSAARVQGAQRPFRADNGHRGADARERLAGRDRGHRRGLTVRGLRARTARLRCRRVRVRGLIPPGCCG